MTSDDWKFLAIVVPLGVAIVGWGFAVRAGRLAKKADDRADEAHALAKKADKRADEAHALAFSAEARADRLERIAKEPRDVRWTVVAIDEHQQIVSAENIGTDSAYNVTLVVDILDREGRARYPRHQQSDSEVRPTHRIGINVSVQVAEERTRQNDAILVSGIAGWAAVGARARLTWQSELGVPGVYEVEDLRF